MIDIWTKYYERWEAVKPRMESFMRSIAPEGSELYEDINSDDYGFGFTVIRGDVVLGCAFQIWDSGDYETGLPGEKGNFHFDLTTDQGDTLGTLCPYNYTERCWADYTDDAEREDRLRIIEDCAEAIRDRIALWITGQ